MSLYFIHCDKFGFVWFDYDNQKIQSTFSLTDAVSYESIESIELELPELKRFDDKLIYRVVEMKKTLILK